MKKNLFMLAAGLFFSLSVSAQWNTDTDVNNLISYPLNANYGCAVKTNQNGVTYEVMEMPYGSNVQTRLQIINKQGYKMFPDEGLLVSDEPTLTWTLIGERVMVDRDGNAVLAVNDQRTGDFSYTLYKYDENGNELWGNVQLNGGESMNYAAGINICQTTDGGYVVAFTSNTVKGYDNEYAYVQLEKISNDGKIVWDSPVKIGDDVEVRHFCPYVVESSDNQCILVYAKGINQDLMARLIDFDGSSAWDEDVVVYNGGAWGTIPLHVMMNVEKGPDNGVLVTWWDGRNNVNYQNCMSYITNEGTYGFSTGVEGTNISNAENFSREYPDFFYDEKDKAIYCVYKQYLQSLQSTCGIYMQKISLDGELLWGPEGKAVIEIQKEKGYSYCSIRKTGDDKLAVFYQEKVDLPSNSPVNSYMRVYDKDGNAITDPVNFTTNSNVKSYLKVSEMIDNKYFLANWHENRKELNPEGMGSNPNMFMQYIDYEKICSGIENITYNIENGELLKNEIFSVSGEHKNGLQKGVNIVRSIYSDGKVKVTKVLH